MKHNQVIAVEKSVRNRTHEEISALYAIVQKPQLFLGGNRRYQKTDDAGEDLPEENQVIQRRMDKVLENVRRAGSELMNITLQQDNGNQHAQADIVVDGVTIAGSVPVTTLMFLEKQLTNLRNFVAAIPVLDPAHDWVKDEGSGIYKTPPQKTVRTKKLQRPIVKYEATDKHPAQTEMITEDVTVGYWNTTLHSAAMPQVEKEKLADRVERLLIAVKQAREKANDIEAPEVGDLGGAIFDFLKIGG